MASADAYKELINSQIPALHLLTGMGWQYLTPDEALTARRGKKSAVILVDILAAWLREHSGYERKGKAYGFSDAHIAAAVRKLQDVNFAQGLFPTGEVVY